MTIAIITVLFVCLSINRHVLAQAEVVVDPNQVSTESEDTMDAMTAVIASVSGGSVQYSQDDGETWKMAGAGVKLTKDATVRTGFSSRCEIDFRDSTIVIVEPLSSVRLSKYIGNETVQKVHTNLQYGAVRCGVEKGRIKSDARVSTPVSTLSIRGTIVYVEYDRGTRRCRLYVEEDGPAMARTYEGVYLLDEAMETDCSLSRYLLRAVYRHRAWITGEVQWGYDDEGLNESFAHYGNTPVWGGGGDSFGNPRTQSTQQQTSYIIDFPGGDIPIGDQESVN